jgi:hypothetical protein
VLLGSEIIKQRVRVNRGLGLTRAGFRAGGGLGDSPAGCTEEGDTLLGFFRGQRAFAGLPAEFGDAQDHCGVGDHLEPPVWNVTLSVKCGRCQQMQISSSIAGMNFFLREGGGGVRRMG